MKNWKFQNLHFRIKLNLKKSKSRYDLPRQDFQWKSCRGFTYSSIRCEQSLSGIHLFQVIFISELTVLNKSISETTDF